MTMSIDITVLAVRLAKRRAELGLSAPNRNLMNDGSARTPSKRALLRARDEMAVAQGKAVTYPANY